MPAGQGLPLRTLCQRAEGTCHTLTGLQARGSNVICQLALKGLTMDCLSAAEGMATRLLALRSAAVAKP